MSRVPDAPILDLFLQRHSSRALSGEPLRAGELEALLEAARWAPSGGNVQPWRVVRTVSGTPAFEAVLHGLADSNQVWARRAGALLVWTSKTTYGEENKPMRTHAFDAGAAWMGLALEGAHRGLVVHAMGGFEETKVRAAVRVPADHEIHAVVAVGNPGRLEDLPEKLQAREAPSLRNSVGEWAFVDAFPG